MIPKLKLTCLFFALLAFFSCEKAQRDTNRIKDFVKETALKKIEKQTTKVKDKVFPPFDADKPDTENNKQRFKDFLKVELTPDVKNIYCFDDAIGLDADYMFAFNCNQSTSDKIIEKHKLLFDTLSNDNGFEEQHDFDWWDKQRIAQLEKYRWTDGKKYHKYYWYDPENEKAYFYDFDIY